MTKAELTAEAIASVFQNSEKQVTASNLQKVLVDIINAMSNESDINSIETLDLSDAAIYDWSTSTLTIPDNKKYAGVIRFSCSTYDGGITYALNNIVKSSGSDGGTAGYCYRSKAAGNVGNALSDGTKWELADVSASVPTGAIQIVSFGSVTPTLSQDHPTQFEVNGVAVRMVATVVSGISTGQIALDANTSVVIAGYGFLTLAYRSGIARKVTGTLLQ